MIAFKSEEDLLRLNPADPAYPLIEKFVDRLITEARKSEFGYSWRNDGYLLYVFDESDIDRPLTEIWGEEAYSLIDIPWEGITMDESGQFYVCVFLANNEFGLVFIVNSNLIHGELLDCFEANLDP